MKLSTFSTNEGRVLYNNTYGKKNSQTTRPGKNTRLVQPESTEQSKALSHAANNEVQAQPKSPKHKIKPQTYPKKLWKKISLNSVFRTDSGLHKLLSITNLVPLMEYNAAPSPYSGRQILVLSMDTTLKNLLNEYNEDDLFNADKICYSF